MNNPLVSIVMSVYNGSIYLDEAIKSILNQTYIEFEFIIINDGSTDNSRQIIKSYSDERIILLDQENTGLSIALNNGIKLAKGKYIARMDADDIAHPERISKQLEFLELNNEYVLVGTNAKIIDMYGEYVYSSNMPIDWNEINSRFPESSFFHSSVMYRKEKFINCGGYFEDTSKLYSFEDSILWNKMKVIGKMANLPELLISYRLLPNASTTKASKTNKIINEILYEIIRDNSLSDFNRKRLVELKTKSNQKEKNYSYHIHLAKKYLWNNFNRSKSHQNIFKAIALKPKSTYTYLLFLLSLLPKSMILAIYKTKN